MPNKHNFESFIDTVDSIEDNRSMFGYLKKDIPASIVVFLVALPLCLGIALASGAPLASGLIAGIIGGIVTGYISRSGTSVSGPAASVSAIAYAAIISLGSFDLFLVAVVISGLFQIGLGLLKAGLIADYMPTSIIKGLLAGIGFILILSQLPYAFGLDLPKDGLLDYSAEYIKQSKEMIPLLWSAFSPGALIISGISLSIIVFWEKTRLKDINWLPSSLFVVFVGVLINFLFKYLIPDLYLSGSALVRIPDIENIGEFIVFPNFTGLLNFEVWTTAITIAVVASIATLLNLEAVDNIDPHKRKSPPNRELIAQGIGNSLSGLIGGIPITSVIVRSSVNLDAGAETKLSTILHGIFLLVSVLFLSSIINLIPLASLAVILIVVGYKLASIKVFKKLYKKGWDQFIPFAITVIGIVFIDLLIGIFIGSAVAVFFLLKSNYHNPFFIENTKSFDGETIRLELSNEVSFLNKASIKNTLWSIPRNSNLIIDATFSSFIDNDVLEILDDFRSTFAKEHDINVSIVGLKEEYKAGSELDFEKFDENLFVSKIDSPEVALNLLKDGNRRYVQGNLVSRRLRTKENVNGNKDKAFAVVAGCIDLQESLNILLDTGIGDLIAMRFAGNTINKDILTNLEIVCRTQNIKVIVLLGHSGNYIIEEALEHYLQGKDTLMSSLIKDSIPKLSKPSKEMDAKEKLNYINELTKQNIQNALDKIFDQSEYVSELVEKGSVGIVTAFLDRPSGEIEFSELYVPEMKS